MIWGQLLVTLASRLLQLLLDRGWRGRLRGNPQKMKKKLRNTLVTIHLYDIHDMHMCIQVVEVVSWFLCTSAYLTNCLQIACLHMCIMSRWMVTKVFFSFLFSCGFPLNPTQRMEFVIFKVNISWIVAGWSKRKQCSTPLQVLKIRERWFLGWWHQMELHQILGEQRRKSYWKI